LTELLKRASVLTVQNKGMNLIGKSKKFGL